MNSPRITSGWGPFRDFRRAAFSVPTYCWGPALRLTPVAQPGRAAGLWWSWLPRAERSDQGLRSWAKKSDGQGPVVLFQPWRDSHPLKLCWWKHPSESPDEAGPGVSGPGPLADKLCTCRCWLNLPCGLTRAAWNKAAGSRQTYEKKSRFCLNKSPRRLDALHSISTYRVLEKPDPLRPSFQKTDPLWSFHLQTKALCG